MTRFERIPTTPVYTAIALALGAVLVSDLVTSLGIAAIVFYLVPMALSYFTWRPIVPPAVALLTTVLILTGYYASPPGIDPGVAALNRLFIIATVWVLAGLGYQFIRSKLAVRKQEWLQEGQTQLSARMAGDPSPAMLGEKVVSFLCDYLNAQAGAIYLEDAGAFRRVASSGVPADAGLPETFQRGDGLLGRAAVDRRVATLHDVPDGYLIAGSALGRSKPRHLLIAPFTVDGTVNAVVELGFFQPVQETDRELLARVSESVAVAVRSARYRAALQELLEETQRQAEELQAQSEELRVNNEELEEHGRALRESQLRLEQQQTELEQTNMQLEEQAAALEAKTEELGSAKQALETRARELQQAGRYKSEFLANMSHELRTPLNASLILARQLADNREGNLTPDQIKHAQTIESAGRDLLALINDVLDLTKVEAGYLEVRSRATALARLIESLRGTFHPLAEHKGLRFTIRAATEAPQTLETDDQRLEQILKNLLSNALKFTERGEVALEVGRKPDGRIAFVVRDTGIGIAEEQREIIFEPFCQADGSTHRKYGGTGLGLSISRQLASLLGGEITLESAVGQGSAFTLVLPERYEGPHPLDRTAPLLMARRQLPSAPAPRPAEPPPPPTIEDDRERLIGGRRILLLVEDDEAFARILYDLAHEMEFQALIATSAGEALALAAQYRPSAAVIDVGLPDHNGLSVLDRLKIDARTRHIPIHVVSVHDYMETALSLGAVGYALKPVKREELLEAFRRLDARIAPRVRRLLIVEDDPAQRESLHALLGTNGVETVGVASAAECLDRLANTTFDCMVLDLNLPDASGFTLLDRLSREDRYSFPPVIVYTGRDLTADEEAQLRRYSKSVIIKGAKSPERLLDEVTLFLHQVVAELPPAQQAMLAQARRRDAVLDGRRILLAEDDVRNVYALTGVLEATGAKLIVARNGREALEALERSTQPGVPPVDLVLMDVMMPEMDGLTALRQIRASGEWQKLPVIVLTAKAMKQDQERAFAAGANDYMAKPIDVDKLLSLVRVWMPR